MKMRSKEKWVTESKANRQEEPGDEELLVLHFIYIYIRHFYTWLIPLYGRWTKRVHSKRREACTELRDVTNHKMITFVVATMGT